MNNVFGSSRRDFIKKSGLGGLSLMAMPNMMFSEEMARKFDIGATFILWGYGPDNLEPALRDISKLGYHSFETFGEVIQEWEENRGGIGRLIDQYGVPIKSAFCNADVLDTSKRKDELKNLIKWGKMLKKANGTLIEFNCSGIDRKGYDYRKYKTNIIDSMNEYAKAITDLGLVCALHQHTDTPVETEEEVYFVMENVNTDYMKFGPDVGQLEKGGADPVKIFKDFMPLIEHVHLKDFEGGDNGYLGYAPLGEGEVRLKKLLRMLERGKDSLVGGIMFELDSDKEFKPAYTELEAAGMSKDYLARIGYTF